MSQFPVTPSRKRILDRIPDYAVTVEPAESKVTISYDGTVIAESENAMMVSETKHAAVYYLPREDVNMAMFSATDLSTYCPFKGHASYWTLNIGDTSDENIVWSYESPYPEVEGLKDTMSFYTDRTTIRLSQLG